MKLLPFLAVPAVGLVLALVIGGGMMGGGTVTNTPAMNTEMSQADQVPVELRDLVRQTATDAGLDWVAAAAYLQVQYHWRLPIPTRQQLTAQPVVIPCPPDPNDGSADDKKQKAPPDPPKVCTRPPTRAEVEQRWQDGVKAWLPGEMARLAAAGEDYESLGVTADQVREMQDAGDAIREVEGQRMDPMQWSDFLAANGREDDALVLRDLEWAHAYPLPGVAPADNWHDGQAVDEDHQGTDLPAPAGMPVLAVADGTLRTVTQDTDGGWGLELQDDFSGSIFWYWHMSSSADGVTQGAHVTSGQVLGTVGSSPLRFGFYQVEGDGGQAASNPYPYLIAWYDPSQDEPGGGPSNCFPASDPKIPMGLLAWPTTVHGPITSPFGPRWGACHHGIDIAVSVGTPIHAAYAGTVVESTYDEVCGRYVRIDHGSGVTTRYCHASQLLAQVGQHVAQGDVIELSGGALDDPGRGWSTGAHLHFEVAIDNLRHNPMLYLPPP